MTHGLHWLPEPASMGAMELDVTVTAALVLFLLVYAFLSNVVIKPYMELLQKREFLTAGTKDAAVAMHHQAEDAMSRYEQSLKEARLEAASLREGLRRDAQSTEEELIAKARAESDARKARDQEALVAEKVRARTDAERRASGLGSDIARRVLAQG